MNNALIGKIITEATQQISDLLAENASKLGVAMDSARNETPEDKACKFAVTAKITVEPEHQQAKVSTAVGWSRKFSDDCEPATVSTQPGLFDQDGVEMKVAVPGSDSFSEALKEEFRKEGVLDEPVQAQNQKAEG